MSRRLTVPMVIGVAALVLAAAGGTGPGASWADAQHGWTAQLARTACKPRAAVCSTENGGVSWHGIFDTSSEISAVLRTSARAGLISTARSAGITFWTRDNGRRWYRTRLLEGPFAGSGGYLYWHEPNAGGALYQVRPWPPKRKLNCVRGWATGPFARAPKSSRSPTRARKYCADPSRPGGMSNYLVAELDPADGFAALAPVPGGVLAVVARSAPPHRVLIRRNGRNTLVDLPAPGGDLRPCADQAPLVSWPNLVVLGCRSGVAGESAWVSHDGGSTWTLARA